MKKDKVRLIQGQELRVETGAVQFGDDWPGLFIRGDMCFQLYLSITAVLAEHVDEEGEIDFKNIGFMKAHNLSILQYVAQMIKDEVDATGAISMPKEEAEKEKE